MSRGPIPDLPRDRPKVPDVVPLIREIYASPGGAVGCCLHVLVDDGNYDCAEYCFEVAKERGHARCERAAMLLMLMSPSQIRRVCAVNYYQPEKGETK